MRTIDKRATCFGYFLELITLAQLLKTWGHFVRSVRMRLTHLFKSMLYYFSIL